MFALDGGISKRESGMGDTMGESQSVTGPYSHPPDNCTEGCTPSERPLLIPGGHTKNPPISSAITLQ